MENTVDIKDLMWIVGFWEGEGTAGFWKAGKQGRRLSVSISQKEKYVLEEIKRLVGFGYITRLENQGLNHGHIFRWLCSDKSARIFLQMIIPYIKSKYKKEQATIALREDSKKIKINFHTPLKEKEEIQRYLLQKVPYRTIKWNFDRNYTTILKYKKELFV